MCDVAAPAGVQHVGAMLELLCGWAETRDLETRASRDTAGCVHA